MSGIGGRLDVTSLEVADDSVMIDVANRGQAQPQARRCSRKLDSEVVWTSIYCQRNELDKS